MANIEHVRIAESGTEALSRWRREHPDVRPDLSGADLSEASLGGAPLEHARLQGSRLIRADLRGASLRGAHLGEAALGGADLRGAHLQEARLQGAHLRGTRLEGAHLERAHLELARLREAHLQGVRLHGAQMKGASLPGTNLRDADLRRVRLDGAQLQGASLERADLRGAELREADLRDADLRGARLEGASLQGAELDGARLRHACLADTALLRLDLSGARGLEEVEHRGPSMVGLETLALSRGRLPEAFLKGCGLRDWEILAAPLWDPMLPSDRLVDLQYRMFDVRLRSPIQIDPLFISYSHADAEFVDVLQRWLDERGVRSWRDVRDATVGRLERVVDRAMRLHPTVLLVLSEHSVDSDWVRHEAECARELERELGRDVLCPIALDGTWRRSHWPKRLRRQVEDYHILDLSSWRDPDALERGGQRLLEGLSLFYGEPSGRTNTTASGR